MGKAFNLRMFLRRLEERLLKRALRATYGNKTQAALRLGIGRTALVMKCKKFKLMTYGGPNA
jgi:DNA-binding protein Fis